MIGRCSAHPGIAYVKGAVKNIVNIPMLVDPCRVSTGFLSCGYCAVVNWSNFRGLG